MDEKDALAAVAKGMTQAFLKPFYDVWDNLLLPYLEGRKDRLSDDLWVERRMNLLRLKVKWDKFTAEMKAKPISPKIFLPIVEYASIEDNDDLHTRWAALLANASDPDAGRDLTSAFIDILRQITPVDAIYMDTFYDRVCALFKEHYPEGTKITPNSIQKMELSVEDIKTLYDLIPMDKDTLQSTSVTQSELEKHEADLLYKMSDMALIVRNCLRLGLIDRTLKVKRQPGKWSKELYEETIYVFVYRA